MQFPVWFALTLREYLLFFATVNEPVTGTYQAAAPTSISKQNL